MTLREPSTETGTGAETASETGAETATETGAETATKPKPPWQVRFAIAGRRDGVIAWLIAGMTVAILLATAQQGFVRDEGYYFRAAADYHRYFEAIPKTIEQRGIAGLFQRDVIDRYFAYNTEHPGLVKILMGFTWKVAHQWLGLTSHATGFRLASMMLVALGNAFLYLLGVRMFGRRIALLAVTLLMLNPHVFYHSHLACFDGPIMGMMVAATYAFVRSLEKTRWVLLSGLFWGLAIATKHNAVFLLPTLLLAYGCSHWRDIRWSWTGLQLPPLPLAVPAMLVLAPLVFFLFYPYGWPDPLSRINSYYQFHLHHEHYPVDYFGTLYTEPPFPLHFPFVMSALTTPLTILLPGLLGFVMLSQRLWQLGRARIVNTVNLGNDDASMPPDSTANGEPPNRERLHLWLLFWSVLIPPAVIALPTVPIFGGTKHWMTMMPYFCLLAAWVVVRAAAWLQAQIHSNVLASRLAVMALVVLVLALPAFETARTHPLGHTYFNELTLGHQGAALLGMPRTFWGGDGRELLGILNRDARLGAKVFTDRMNLDDFRAYQRDGLLRKDLRYITDVQRADWAFINHQREYQDNEYRLWAAAGDQRPVGVVEFDGVPIVSLYRLEGR